MFLWNGSLVNETLSLNGKVVFMKYIRKLLQIIDIWEPISMKRLIYILLSFQGSYTRKTETKQWTRTLLTYTAVDITSGLFFYSNQSIHNIMPKVICLTVCLFFLLHAKDYQKPRSFSCINKRHYIYFASYTQPCKRNPISLWHGIHQLLSLPFFT